MDRDLLYSHCTYLGGKKSKTEYVGTCQYVSQVGVHRTNSILQFKIQMLIQKEKQKCLLYSLGPHSPRLCHIPGA